MASTMDGNTVSASKIEATSSGVYDNGNRVFSNSNKPYVVKNTEYINPNGTQKADGYVIIPQALNSNTYALLICFGSFTSSGTIYFAKQFSVAPFVLTSDNSTSDSQSQRTSVSSVYYDRFTTVSSGNYPGRYIAIGYVSAT